MRVLSLAQNHYLSHRKIGAFFVFEHQFFEFLSLNRSKRLDFAYFKPNLAHFLVRHTTLSTWVKTPKGLKMVEKWGWKLQKVSFYHFSTKLSTQITSSVSSVYESIKSFNSLFIHSYFSFASNSVFANTV